jgi:hypothetical protein
VITARDFDQYISIAISQASTELASMSVDATRRTSDHWLSRCLGLVIQANVQIASDMVQDFISILKYAGEIAGEREGVLW